MSSDLICLSHLRWDFVYQRPQHLMSRAALDRRVFFVEEPVYAATTEPSTRLAERQGVVVVTPVLPEGLDPTHERHAASIQALLDDLIGSHDISGPVLWYYTPLALAWTRRLRPSLVVYDSMDDLSGFLAAPPELVDLETELLAQADVVFTGGRRLQERIAARHHAAICFPSSVDIEHFGKAISGGLAEPADQHRIPRPRVGYAGVIDERLDLSLIAEVASRRPAWQIVLLGPTAKIDPASVPTAPNLHALGMKRYDELPAYLAHWDVGWMPFAMNDATRYISPTKTPEYLAAGLPVVSTPIADVVRSYGGTGLVAIAPDATATTRAVEAALDVDLRVHRRRARALLARTSWDRTWREMARTIDEVAEVRSARQPGVSRLQGATLRRPDRRARHGSRATTPRSQPAAIVDHGRDHGV